MITRDEAFTMLENSNPGESLIQHGLATEAVMRGLAKELGKDENLWAITGLLHDLDYPETKDDASQHGLKTAEMLTEQLPEDGIQAIRAHNFEMNGTAPVSDFDYALRCGETVTGLISAAALVRPNGYEGMKPKGLKKKMKDKSFAASVNRDNIKECDKLGIDLGRFLEIGIESMAAME
jgi:putative nucleotidyltransferase with HDIG domain